MRFAYRAIRSAIFTGITGISFLSVAGLSYFSDNANQGLGVVFSLVGLTLILSCVINIFYTQWLTINIPHKSVKFYKKSFFSFVEWEKQSHDFKCIKVSKDSENNNWSICLVSKDGWYLELDGGNFWFFTSYIDALNFARLISSKSVLILKYFNTLSCPTRQSRGSPYGVAARAPHFYISPL